MKVLQIITESSPPDLMKAFEDFLPLAMSVLKIDKLPPIKIVKDVPGSQPSFGGFDQDAGVIYLQITNRHPLDIFRTLAHELVHFKQKTEHKLDGKSGTTGSPEENEANATAGIVMRHFNKKYPQYLQHKPLIKEDASNYEIRNYEKLDNILMLLCKMIIKGQKKDKDYYGMVAACVLDPDNNMVAKVNYPTDNGKRVHAERAAMKAYQDKYGKIPEGSIIITTCSPCNEISDETADGRSGNNCTDLINNSPVHKVYCGYMDPSQGNEEHEERDFNLMETENGKIRDLCKSFAATWLDINESLTPNTIHKLADRKGVKWDNEPSFLQLTKQLTGLEHLDDLDQAGLEKVKHHLEKQGVADGSEQKPVIIYTNNRGATIDDDIKKSLPVTELPANKLQMGEKHKSMKDPKIANWVTNKLLPELKQNGVLKPLLVWNNDGEFFVIDGNHRFIAYQVAGHQGRVPVQIVPDNMVNISDTLPGQQDMVKENFADGKNPGRKEIDPDVYEDLSNSIIARTARQIVPTIRAKSTPEGYVYLSTQDGLSLVIGCNIADGSIDINIGSQPMETTSSGPHKGAVTKIIEAVYQAAAKQYGAPIKQGTLSIDHDAGHGVWQHIAQKLGLQYDANMVKENFADGKNPGRKGLAKRSGVNTKASVSTLRNVAKHSSGEKQRMAHWLANMKAGRAK
jgi:pyrimidine deaminase RibD-like protein